MKAWGRVLTLLCGLWAFSMGIRLTYELLVYGSTVVTGTAWFDWIPLAGLGFFVTYEFFPRVAGDLAEWRASR